MIVKADDFGLYHGNPKIIASLLFPLSVPTERKVASWLSELCNAGLVATYTAEDGKKYLKLLSWDKHQNRRAMKSKFPLPETIDNNCTQEETSEENSTCEQLQTDSSVNENENVNVNENVNEKRKRVTAQNGAGGDDRFERFWTAYPRRVGKKDAVKVWNQIKPDDGLIDRIVAGVERWKLSEQWTKDDGRFIPYPATFLRGERWNEYDRAQVTPSPKPTAVKNYDDGEDFLGGD